MSLTKNKNVFIDFTKEPQTNQVCQTTYAVPTAVDTQINFAWIGGNKYIEWRQTGADGMDSALFFAPKATTPFGWTVPSADNDAHGNEVTMGMGASSSMGSISFTVGTDAAFFCRVRAVVPTLAGSDAFVAGFRNLAAYAAITDPAGVLAVYDDKANVGYSDATVAGIVNSAYSVANVDTETLATNTPIVAGQAFEFMVVVSATGVVSYYVALDAETTPLSRSSTPDLLLNGTPLSITTAIVLIPYIAWVDTGTAAGIDSVLQEWEVGYW